MAKKLSLIPADRIEKSILLIRGQKVILDSDLAELYGVETRILVRNVKRSLDRFPGDFMLQLSAGEWDALRSQIGISKSRGGRRPVKNDAPVHLRPLVTICGQNKRPAFSARDNRFYLA